MCVDMYANVSVLVYLVTTSLFSVRSGPEPVFKKWWIPSKPLLVLFSWGGFTGHYWRVSFAKGLILLENGGPVGGLCTSSFFSTSSSGSSSWPLHWESRNRCLGASVSSVLIALKGPCSAPMDPLQTRQRGATGWVLGTWRMAQAD